MKNTRLIILILLVLVSACAFAQADTWQDKMKIGGFSVIDIKGLSENSAKGRLVVPICGVFDIDLTKDSSGIISGKANISTKITGANISGSGILTDNGLHLIGNWKSDASSMLDINLTSNADNYLMGNGNMRLDKTWVNLAFNIASSGSSLTGGADLRSHRDTRFAVYDFGGTLKLSGNLTKLEGIVNGNVERRGKLSNKSTVYKIENMKINILDGTCVVNINGVDVKFDLFEEYGEKAGSGE